MILTDTHTHLYYEQDAEKRDALMQRCFDNGITRLFLPNVDIQSVSNINTLLHAYPHACFPMLGMHPCSVKGDWEAELNAIKKSDVGPIYAIGEIGIDLYWDKTNLPDQVKAFKQQIAWAKSVGLPIVIHCREAFNEVFEVLEEEKDELLRGIFHCFTGNAEQAQHAIDLGFYLGVGGVVTYKNGGLDKILPQFDLSHIVLETDSPYLSPVPHRGKPNESSYLIYVAQKLAEIYHTDVESVAEITTANSKKIFGV
ncbi:TatD family hydrolase [Mucilaginibacter calamicampi]|uniref:TatD family hydrolase n=1 Tax=Mucilaginibacter calamicampi TaxID=1302352 RepID=A0ABW2Z0D2_9SPHI